jgi:predicted DNA-binding transcriptional regulator AlpA
MNKKDILKLDEYDLHKLLFKKRIWTIEDVSLFTGFAKKTIWNKTSRREIPHRKCGNRLFFMPDEILNWIEEGE